MRLLTLFVITSSCSYQNVVSGQLVGATLPNSIIDLELAKVDSFSTFAFNIFQRFFQQNILDIIKHVDLTLLLDDIDGNLQQYLNKFKQRLPPHYQVYAELATDYLAVLKATNSELKPILAMVAGVYLQTMRILIDKYGIEEVDKVFTLSDVISYKKYYQYLFILLNKRLVEAGASEFVKNSLLGLKTVNQKYDGKYSNIPASIQYVVYFKALVGYQCLTAQGVKDSINQLHQLNLGNFLKHSLTKIDRLLTDLKAFKANSLVEVGKYVRTELTKTPFEGLPQTLIGGSLYVILLSIKSLLKNISPDELKKVIATTNTLEATSAVSNLESILDKYELSIKKSGNEGAILGVIILAHSFTRFMNAPFKTALRASILLLAVAIDAALEHVSKSTLAKLLGTAKVNYILLAIVDKVSVVLGLPTGS